MDVTSYFDDFLKNIAPSAEEREEYQKRHTELRERLHADEALEPLIIDTFLQGSYRRATLIRPGPADHADVDVVVVTKMSQEDTTPEQALDAFIPFLEKHYRGQYEKHGRSIGITLARVDLDLVVTSAPSESQLGIFYSDAVTGYDTPEDAEDWKLVPSWVSLARRTGDFGGALVKAAQEEEWKIEPLEIPDRDAHRWEPTHPLEQIRWTHEKNRLTNGNYIRVVRALKEWKRTNSLLPKYPKGYPLEHLIGVCCPDGIHSVAEGVTATLEEIQNRFADAAATRTSPQLPDYGVPEHDVFHRISGEEFASFYDQAVKAARTARTALDADSLEDSATGWGELFGSEFPKPPGGGGAGGNSGPSGPKGGYTPRKVATVVGGGRFG